MPIEVRVGPAVVTINQGTTFLVAGLNGEIDSQAEQGAFARDTRFINSYRMWINQRPWTLLSYSALSHFAARWVYTNPSLRVEDGEIAARQLSLTVERALGNGLHDDIDIVNYGRQAWTFFLEFQITADFADIFDVKTHRLTERGEKATQWDRLHRELVTSYEHHGFRRALQIRIRKSSSPPRYANGQLSFHIELQPGGNWHTCMLTAFEGTDADHPIEECYAGGEEEKTPHGRAQLAWHQQAAKCRSSNTLVERTFLQSVEDMGALRIPDPSKKSWIPAAGIPWFVTLFGRDSLIVSFQNLLLGPTFAEASLTRLAEMQAREVDDYRDAQPGKIPHEIRHGELAALKLIPHTPYYGTHDATALYLIVLAEAYRWIGDLGFVRDHLDAAERCLRWIDRYGDLDQDGFQEYQPRAPTGYHNQGWKDASDAIVYPDGTQVDTPIGTCELQGYVYDAKLRMAELYDRLEDVERATALRREALELKRRFNQAFWMPGQQFVALGLDPKKRQIESIASNAGHCLWSGIVDADKGPAVVNRLLQEDMWSGWGIRTLSARHPAFNPFSYQLGSIWPHDNAIIAAGFRRYGFPAEAATVARAIFDAAGCFVSFRLPEVFAGLERLPSSFPVQYLGASIPQAWAAGSAFMFIRALLGLDADAANRQLLVDPWLPDWLPDLELRDLRLAAATFDLGVRGKGSDVEVKMTVHSGEVTMVRPPQGGPAT